jgi:spermidine synthase
VIEVGKKYFSKSTAVAYGDPRLKLIIDDAARYLREEGKAEQYDVIICDSSDPVGPADVLFQPEFFNSMKGALNPETGIICTQGECLWLHLDLIHRVMGNVRELFPKVNYAFTTIPTYPSGQIGFMIATLDANADLTRKFCLVFVVKVRFILKFHLCFEQMLPAQLKEWP